jgi:hypothetical protein
VRQIRRITRVFWRPFQEPGLGVLIHGGKVSQHDPCVLGLNLDLVVHPFGLGIKSFGLNVYPFGIDVHPLHPNDLFGEVEVDGNRGLFFQAPLLIPFVQGDCRFGHDLLQGLAQHKG